jgi:hypothetical protein
LPSSFLGPKQTAERPAALGRQLQATQRAVRRLRDRSRNRPHAPAAERLLPRPQLVLVRRRSNNHELAFIPSSIEERSREKIAGSIDDHKHATRPTCLASRRQSQ